jgi:transcriptional/translational regulatory protein YebC/TACO1
VILVDADRYSEDDLMPAIDAGAEDVSEDGDLLKVLTPAASLSAVREALQAAGVEVQSAELSMEPKSVVDVGEEDAPTLVRLMEVLDEQDDVDAVYANFDIPAEILERTAA